MKKYKVLAALALLVIAMQFFPSDLPETEPENQKSITFSGIADEQVISILKKSCFDCHSEQTVFPWYSKVKPISWLLADHIREGREHLNFSAWQDYSKREQVGHIEDIVEESASGSMPLKSYTLVHKDSRLDAGKIKTLQEWGVEATASLFN
ncbi:MAG TPA: heme-binding domain-containing protein [Bacteroidales bacterium]|nr:heme-binding domain-containing protein [Bacteroidales bacterium]